MVSYYSLYCIFLRHGGFVKLFQSPENFLNDIIILIDRLRRRHDGNNTTAHIQWASYPRNKPGSQKLFWRMWQAGNSIGLNRRHLVIRYLDNIIHPCYGVGAQARA